ncbi:hypothetical protein [Sphingobium sp.]|uniref:hypothetical protein n=1 Tax=Sphingobium sp. TaxID=1912891 RepID=UPI003BB6C4ED
MKIFRWAGAMALALMLSPCASVAQSVGTSVQAPAGWAPMQAPCVQQVNGTCLPVSATNPLPVTGGGGGGGGGDASAANQATQITAEQAIRDRIGDVTAPATGSSNARLESIRSLLAAPLTVATHAVTGAVAGRPVASTVAGGTIAAANTFQSVLASNSNRAGCLIQNTSTAIILVYQGAPGSATAAAANPVGAGGSFACGGAGIVITNEISVTSATAGATFVVSNQ